MTPVDERLTPHDTRWVRSDNNVLHAAPLHLSSGTTTPCGLVLTGRGHMTWSPFCGRVPHYVLDRSPWPVCKHCEVIVEWLDADGSGPSGAASQGATPGPNAERLGVDPDGAALAAQDGPRGPSGDSDQAGD